MLNWLALILFLFPLAFSPGPGNLFFAALAGHSGLSAITWPLAGYHLATLLMAATLGVGLMNTLYTAPLVAQMVGIAGSLYVFYLAAKLVRAPALALQPTPSPPRNAGFVDGAILLLLNPKAYFIIILMFTQFEPAQFYPAWPMVGALMIATVFTLNNLVAFMCWAFAGDQLLKRFRSPKNQQRINQVFGTVLGVVALWMLLSNL